MSTGRRRPRGQHPYEVSTRLPHPDEYFTDSGLSWTFQIVDVSPAVEHLAPGHEVSALSIKRNITVPAVMVTCAHGALGFAPDEETAVIRHALDVIGQAVATLGSGFRATGFGRMRGLVISAEGEAVTVEIGIQLCQRRGEPEATITPEIRRAIFIRKV